MNDVNDAYIDRIEAGFLRLDASIRAIDERLRQAENREAGSHPIITSRLDAAWRKIDEHERELAELKTDIQELTHSAKQLTKILSWILGVITFLICSVLGALATGHLVLAIP